MGGFRFGSIRQLLANAGPQQAPVGGVRSAVEGVVSSFESASGFRVAITKCRE